MSEKIKTAAEAQERVNETLNAKVLRVMTPQGNDDRITLVIDKELKTIDFSLQEEKMSNKFGLNIFNLINQVREFVPEIQLAETLAMGQMTNPQIIALAMTNAEITFIREFKSADEMRYGGNESYGRDLYKTTIVGVKTHISPQFSAVINKLTMEKPAVVRQAATIDFFNI